MTLKELLRKNKQIKELYHFYLESIYDIRNYRYKKIVKKLLHNSDELDLAIANIKKIASSSEKKTYYIIRRDNSSIGLLTYVSLFLGHIAYAIAKGYIPVVDMQNFHSIYLNEEDFGKKNAWEFYFKQPLNSNLDDIYKAGNYVLSPTKMQPLSPFINSVFDRDESIFWKKICENFIHLSDQANSYIQDEYINLINGKKVLGLLYRGTDYTKMKPYGHPIQPDIDTFISKIEELIAQWGEFDYIYIATEEKAAVNKLKEKFPNKILENKRVYYDDLNVDFLFEASFNRENDRYLKGIEYLSSIYILSKCNSFIGGLCAGTYATNFMNSTDFENKFFFDLGKY
ncbi:hypothetical protein IW15_06240 [Chryseobacterium soli]|uniref:Uncharacterized protein n=1 Tax=Chryseobacterium soli TaxID=445961 RepID=A0A086A9M7_9FLAO|nr:hypothetical protein [Chryseobacterium soli]KFF13391.1 hypothetical protein IW15_06240 [Chryseobacterium soli]